MLGPFRCRGNDELRRGDCLPARRMMLPDPGFIVAQPVQVLDHLDVAGDGQRRVVAPAMKRSQENAELHAAPGHQRCPRKWAAMLAHALRYAKSRARTCTARPISA